MTMKKFGFILLTLLPMAVGVGIAMLAANGVITLSPPQLIGLPFFGGGLATMVLIFLGDRRHWYA